ncbi:MAG: c-type cytochrome [Casimicrobiaceae bacterium]|nr:c-type cytochrome [Casimicrobiaceae bacterium]MCX8097923.1 c-type cytochrome [Casimicrobiaceae bacterium]MDW8312747.1 c-type cytochrome [Burkholderiales bacterium]
MKQLALTCAIALGLACSAYAQKFSGLGRPATPAEIKAWDIDVRPDFTGLPPGRGSVKKGQEVWEAKCESCHGVFGESNEVFTPIVGGTTKEDMKTGRVANLKNEAYPQRTTMMKLSELSTLWDYINRAMPWNAPKTLTVEEVYAVTAYILHLSDIVPADFVLSHENIREVQKILPNRNGKVFFPGMWSVKGKPDVQGSSCMSNCAKEVKITSSLPDYARNAHGQIAEQMRGFGPVRGIDALNPPRAKFEPIGPSGTTVKTAAAAPTAAAKPDGLKLAQQHACMACHGTTNRLVGPSMAEIGKRYADRADKVAFLAARIKSGGSGVWGSVPMPAQPHIPEADLLAIAEWIAAGRF